MRTSQLTLTLLLLTFALSSTVMGATAQPPPIEDVVVPVLQTPVTLDGVFSVGEWSDAVELSVTFRFYNATTMEIVENRTGFLYLKHDCVDLWICVQMEDPIENVTIWHFYPIMVPTIIGDCMLIFYDASGDMSPGWPGDDEKGVFHPDFTFDSAILPSYPGWDMDTNLGGTKDIDGASDWTGGWLTVELVHPLNSGDAAGNDPALYPGDEILAQFVAMDPEEVDADWSMAVTEEWAYLFNLRITRCAVGGEILPINALESMAPNLLVLTIAAAVTGALLKRRLA